MSGEAGVAAVAAGTAAVVAVHPGLVGWASPHVPVMVGLLLGSLALGGIALDQGGQIKPRKIVGHFMMLGMLGLLAETGNDFLQLPTTMRTLAGAAMAMLGVKAVLQFRIFSQRQLEHRLPGDRPDVPADPGSTR